MSHRSSSPSVASSTSDNSLALHDRHSTRTIIYHANAIGGWFSAFFADAYYQAAGVPQRQLFPMTPGTIPSSDDLQFLIGTHVLLLDLSIDPLTRAQWLALGVLSIDCIDSHASSISHWETPIHTHQCTLLQVLRRFTSDPVFPSWVYAIDRFERWDNPSLEDRALRLHLLPIATLPCNHPNPVLGLELATQRTLDFIAACSDPQAYQALLDRSLTLLAASSSHFGSLLDSYGKSIRLSPSLLRQWNLPSSWKHKSVFLFHVRSSFDSSEAAHHVLSRRPDVDVCVFYRYRDSSDSVTYSIRSRQLDLTRATPFIGHASSAGATLPVSHSMPFLPPNPSFVKKPRPSAPVVASNSIDSTTSTDSP